MKIPPPENRVSREFAKKGNLMLAIVPVCLLFLVALSSFRKSGSYPAPDGGFVSAPLQPLRTIVIGPGHGGPDIGARGEISTEADDALAIALELGRKLQAALPDTKIVFTRTDHELPGHLMDHNEANRLRARIANEAHGDLFISIHLNEGGIQYRSEVIGHHTETYYTGKGKKRKAHTHRVTDYRRYKLDGTATGTETYVWALNKFETKKNFANDNEELSGERVDSNYRYFDSPEAKALASIRTAKYFSRSCTIASFVEDEFTKSGRNSRGAKQRDNEGIWVLQATAMPSILVETGFISNHAEEEYLVSPKGIDEVSDCVMKAVLHYKQYLESNKAAAPPPTIQ